MIYYKPWFHVQIWALPQVSIIIDWSAELVRVQHILDYLKILYSPGPDKAHSAVQFLQTLIFLASTVWSDLSVTWTDRLWALIRRNTGPRFVVIPRGHAYEDSLIRSLRKSRENFAIWLWTSDWFVAARDMPWLGCTLAELANNRVMDIHD